MPGYHTNTLPVLDIPGNVFGGDPGGKVEAELR